jgi:hypothetical protein
MESFLGNSWFVHIWYLPQSILLIGIRAHYKQTKGVILTLLSCDLALFHFDGTELDSGTVAEFMPGRS